VNGLRHVLRFHAVHRTCNDLPTAARRRPDVILSPIGCDPEGRLVGEGAVWTTPASRSSRFVPFDTCQVATEATWQDGQKCTSVRI
jgi:hypothetical protein